MADPGEDEWLKLPVEEQLTHKLWKARSHAYETLAKQFQLAEGEDDDVFRTWNRDHDWPRKAVTDANAVAQEKGVQLVSIYARLAGKPATRCRSECVTPLVEKCLALNARKGTREAAVECILGWAESEADGDKGEGVVTALIEGLGAKQPKVVGGSVAALQALVAAFGIKTISPKPILKVLPKIFAHADKSVRAEGTNLTQTLYAYLGPALDPSLGELKPLQVKELHDSFTALDAEGKGKGTGKPTRETAGQKRERLQREAQEALEGSKGETGEDEVEEDAGAAAEAVEPEPDEDIDPYDLAEPVAVLKELPEGFYAHLASSKWKERKEEALDPLHETLKKAIKIAPDHYDELIKALAGRMGDANILCVIGAANCLESLAKGLRADFGKYKSVMLGPMLEKFKEKKVNVVEALSNSLDAMANTVALSELTEDIVNFSKHKNPAVKEQTMKFLVRGLRNTEKAIPKADLKPLVDLLLGGVEDAVVPVRDAAAEALGTLQKLVGPATMSPFLSGLEELRKVKVQEYFDKAEVKYKPPKVVKAPPPKAAAKPAGKPKAKAAPPPVEKENEDVRPNSPPKAKPAARPAAKKPANANAAPAKKPAAAGGALAKAGAPKAIEPVKYKMSQEDAEARAPDVFEEAFLTDVANSVWKTRLAAMDSLVEWLNGGMVAEVEAELVFRVLKSKPGLKESNFQVWQRVFAVYQLLADQSSTFSKSCMALSIPALTDKYGDPKIKESAGGALTSYAEKSSLGFVLTHAFEPMTKQKAVKMQAENFVYVDTAIREFGVAGVPMKDLIEFLKTGLKSANAAVRTNATKALVTTKLCIGADISNFLQDLNTQLLATIEGEFAKIADEEPPTPTRTCVDNIPAASASGAGKGKGKAAGGGGDPLDELYPRVELDKLVSSAIVKSCDDSGWKVRKEALEQIQGILEANKRLKPNLGSDITAALKARLTDANKVNQGLALDIIGRIAAGMGKPFERYARPLAQPIVAVLVDKNVGARNNALTAMTAVADACGLDPLISGMSSALELPKPEMRAAALGWLAERLTDPDAAVGLDLSPMPKPVISCLEDRSAEVRKAAQAVLPFVVVSAGYNAVMDCTSSLKPASRATVVPLIDAAKPAAPVKAAKAPAAASKPAKSGASRPGGGTGKPLRAPASSATSRSATPSLEDLPAKPQAGGLRRHTGAAARNSQPRAASPLVAPSPVVSEAPFKTSDPKAKLARAAKETGPLKWIIEGGPRKDQVEQLYLQMGPHINAELLGQLFSKDHHAERDYTAGLAVIEAWAADPAQAGEQYDLSEEEVQGRLTANADLIFKYITIRLYDTNTSISIKCLDIIEQLFNVFHAMKYRMTDHEGSALLPSLIAKSGDSKETMRNHIRSIYKATCTIYPFSKVFASLVENGLKSKNARVRTESAEELSGLFQRHGLSACVPGKALPAIAALISDRDSAVRNAALSALASAYASAGDIMLKHVGPLSTKEQDMLNERVKRTEAPASPKPSSAPSAPSRPSSQSSMSPPTARPSAMSRLAPKGGLRRPSSMAIKPSDAEAALRSPQSRIRPASPALVSPNLGASTSRMSAPSRMPPPPSSRLPAAPAHRRDVSQSSSLQARSVRDSSPGPSLYAQHEVPVGEILSSDDARSTDALKVVQNDIASRPDVLIPSADALVDAISTQMRIAFENLGTSTPQMTLRLCKHLMQTLSGFFDQTQLATAVTKDSLVQLLAQLTQRLQETADNPINDAIRSLSKVLNMVLIRIFHNSDRSACFGALFQVLRMTTADIRSIDDDAELAHRAKYAELVMKCLWKVSKTVKESLEDFTLDPRILLKDIDDFLIAIPPAEWRRRATDNVPLADMPLRTVKTILQQVVLIYGDSVYDMLSLMDNPDQTFVYQYLFRLLNNTRAAAGEPVRTSIIRTSAASPEPQAEPSPLIPTPATPPRRSSNENNHARHQSAASTVLSPEPSRPTSLYTNGTNPDGMGEADLNNLLTEVFAKIGSPSESKKGISELYELLKLHPEAKAKVDKWIGATGTYFQAYLRRALSNLKNEDEEQSAVEVPVVSEPVSPVSTTPRSRPISKYATTPSPGSQSNEDGRSRTKSREQDLTRLQSLFGFSGQVNGEAEAH